MRSFLSVQLTITHYPFLYDAIMVYQDLDQKT